LSVDQRKGGAWITLDISSTPRLYSEAIAGEYAERAVALEGSGKGTRAPDLGYIEDIDDVAGRGKELRAPAPARGRYRGEGGVLSPEFHRLPTGADNQEDEVEGGDTKSREAEVGVSKFMKSVPCSRSP
jgi:hypothetical protein